MRKIYRMKDIKTTTEVWRNVLVYVEDDCPRIVTPVKRVDLLLICSNSYNCAVRAWICPSQQCYEEVIL
jgi:hypothetical protein